MIPGIIPYDLNDAFLFEGSKEGCLVWQPERIVIVLGQSNSPGSSLFADKVSNDSIPVTKRPSGGEAVILTPSTIAITVAKVFPAAIPFREFFRTVNNLIIESLSETGIQGLTSKGNSDIAIGDKKILGSSMKNRNNRLVYHAILNVSEDPALFEKYLRHPGREPDYRAGRRHADFVTSLRAEGYNITNEELISVIGNKLDAYFKKG
jgi:lipoate-protein ligase A